MLSAVSCAGQYPVKAETVRIDYGTHTNSGIAITVSYLILEESLTWNYSEHRNSLALSDVCTYDRQDFQDLVTALSAVRFATKPAKTPTCGGEGWSCSFSNKKRCYLRMDDESTLKGDYQEVLRLIQDFISRHKPEGERLFDKLSAQPHQRDIYGEFSELPEVLRKYQVTK